MYGSEKVNQYGTCNIEIGDSPIRQFLTTDATKSAVQALITSRLDYCNALLAGMPAALG